jgi:hypothetical protein
VGRGIRVGLSFCSPAFGLTLLTELAAEKGGSAVSVPLFDVNCCLASHRIRRRIILLRLDSCINEQRGRRSAGHAGADG